jgi:replicative DNA helicase
LEYFDKYGEAPKTNLENVYYEKLNQGLNEEQAEDIGEILEGLDEEQMGREVNTEHLIEQTKDYFLQRSLTDLSEEIQLLVDKGETQKALKVAGEYISPVKDVSKTEVDFSKEESLKIVEKAFVEASRPLFTYPKALGRFWNDQLVRGGLVALMSIEKRGKTFLMMDMAIRASRQGKTVAFFQAGDMNEDAQIRRFCIHLAQKSDKERYCEAHYQPVVDCVMNQRDTCNKRVRECDFGVFEELSEKEVRKLTKSELIAALNSNPEYEPCHNCKVFETEKLGVPWMKKVRKAAPLDERGAKEVFQKNFIAKKRKLFLSTHPNGTLSVKDIRKKLLEWEKEGIIVDMVIIDYADLLITQGGSDFRHTDNQVWKELRSLSQEKNKDDMLRLVVTATQADAAAYEKDLLTLKNFSENKRKYGHVTAIYGMNQDKGGREKEIGVLRINEILLREGEYDSGSVVHVLQNLRRGRPCVGSYF